MSTTILFPVLVIGSCIAAVIGLNQFAKVETRVAGRVKLAPKLLLGLLAGVAFLFYLDDAIIYPRAGETVRRLFHLPDDVNLVRYGRGGRPSCYTDSTYIRRSIQFTPEQFASYVGSVHDRDLWRPIIPPQYTQEKSTVQFSDDALVWQSLPEPPWMGGQQMVWNIAGAEVRRGLAQCYAFSRVEKSAESIGTDGRVAYTVAACNPRARQRAPEGGARVVAALDSDRQLLNVILQFDSKPDYCDNRLSRWLDATLGVAPEQRASDVPKR